MKHQQVTVDFVGMMFTACSYLALAGAVWILLRLLQACFWLPRHLKKQNDVQQMLQDKIDGYERYILECEEKEKAEIAEKGDLDGDASNKLAEQSEKWKERRECLEMLKHELKKVQEGGDGYDWDKLLEDECLKEDSAATDLKEDENRKMEAVDGTEKPKETVGEENVDINVENKKDK